MSGDTIFFIAVVAVAVTTLVWMFFAVVRGFEHNLDEHEKKIEAGAEAQAREQARAAEEATTTDDAEASASADPLPEPAEPGDLADGGGEPERRD